MFVVVVSMGIGGSRENCGGGTDRIWPVQRPVAPQLVTYTVATRTHVCTETCRAYDFSRFFVCFFFSLFSDILFAQLLFSPFTLTKAQQPIERHDRNRDALRTPSSSSSSMYDTRSLSVCLCGNIHSVHHPTGTLSRQVESTPVIPGDGSTHNKSSSSAMPPCTLIPFPQCFFSFFFSSSSSCL